MQRMCSSGNDQTGAADGGGPRGPYRRAPFATFLAHNGPAILLLSMVKASSVRESLTSSSDGIGYRLELPLIRDPDNVWPGLKWVAGAGMTPKRDHTKVDLLLCPPQKGPARAAVQKSIGPYHAVIQFHPRSGALCLRNQCAKPIVYEDGDPTCHLTLARLPKDPAIKGLVTESCVLYRQSNLLLISDYEFALNFDLRRADQETFRKERDLVLMREFGIRPSRYLDLVPLEHHHVAYNVCIHRRLSQNPDKQKSLFSGVRLHTGEPVAVKTMNCKEKKMRARVWSELYVANIFRDHDGSSGVLGLIDSWCRHGSPPCCNMGVSNNNSFENKTADNEATANKTSEDGTGDDKTIDDETIGNETIENATLIGRNNQRDITEDDWSLICEPSESGHVDYDLHSDNDDKERENEGLPDPRCTVVCYSIPLAEYSFANMPWATVDYQDRLRYFRQTLLGLRTMHRREIVHGSISPKALMLQLDEATENMKAINPNTQPSLRAAISNLGNGWLTSRPRPTVGVAGRPGEDPWIAPEVWERSARNLHVSMPADIWGLAVTWLHTFKPSTCGKINLENYETLLRDIENHIKEPLQGLVQQMIAWQPTERPGVEEALAHECWASLLDEKKCRNTKIAVVKRTAGESGSNGKRVRLLSPEAEDTYTYDPEANLISSQVRLAEIGSLKESG